MSKNPDAEKSLVEQILDEMFTKIQDQEEFDEQVYQGLKQLAEDGGLKKAQRISQVIKTKTGETS